MPESGPTHYWGHLKHPFQAPVLEPYSAVEKERTGANMGTGPELAPAHEWWKKGHEWRKEARWLSEQTLPVYCTALSNFSRQTENPPQHEDLTSETKTISGAREWVNCCLK